MKILSKIKVEKITSTTIISVSEDMTIEYILKNYFSAYMKSAFPVIDSNGNELIGIIILKECLKVPEESKSITTVKKVMLPKDRTIIMNSGDTVDKALNQMVTRNQDKAYICDSKNIPIGVVSKTDLLEAINKRKLFLNQIK